MKVLCPKCNTTYRLADDKLPKGRKSFKVRCKHCGAVIEVAVERGGKEGAKKDEGPEKWYVAVDSEREGPFPRQELSAMIASGKAGPDTLVWRKGFKEWRRLGDVDEFAGELAAAGGGEEDTQLMDLSDVQAGSQPAMEGAASDEGDAQVFPGTGTAEAGQESTGGDGAPEDSQARMVWQRKETSVLFSLDDYKARKKTRPPKAEASVDLKPLDAVDASGPADSGSPAPKATVGVIALDEAEVKRVAEVIRSKKKRRAMIIGVVGGIVALAVVVSAVVLLLAGGGREEARVAGRGEAEAGNAPAKEVVGRSGQTPPVTKAVATKKTPVTEQDAGRRAESPERTGNGKKAAAAQKTPGKKADRPKVAAGKKKGSKPAAKKRTRPAKTGKKAAGKPADKSSDESKKQVKAGGRDEPTATGDVNALLAQFKKGRKGATGGHDSKGTSAGATEVTGTAGLPEQLTMGQIQSVLRRKNRAVRKCIQKAGVAPGTTVKARTRIVISGTGKVVDASVTNAAGAEACIRSILVKLKFPRFKGQNMVVPYPFTVSL